MTQEEIDDFKKLSKIERLRLQADCIEARGKRLLIYANRLRCNIKCMEALNESGD